MKIRKWKVVFLVVYIFILSGCGSSNEVNKNWYDYRMIAHAGGGG